MAPLKENPLTTGPIYRTPSGWDNRRRGYRVFGIQHPVLFFLRGYSKLVFWASPKSPSFSRESTVKK